LRFDPPLIPATLVRRYKRFLADVVLPDGGEITAHVANPGAMTGLAAPGSRVWLSKSSDPKRKLPYAWELVEADLGAGLELVDVNTSHANRIVHEALIAGAIPECTGCETIRREVKYGASRLDFCLETAGKPPCFLEVKNVTLMRNPGLSEFPDAVTARGAKHMRELYDMTQSGHRAVLLFLIQIASAKRFSPAADIDPAYARALAHAHQAGVEVLAYTTDLSPTQITLGNRVPADLAPR
jgi:sugar fermentation stimulation protein A